MLLFSGYRSVCKINITVLPIHLVDAESRIMNRPEYRVMNSNTVILVDTIASEDHKAVSDTICEPAYFSLASSCFINVSLPFLLH